MSTESQIKPDYLGLLNSISLAESNAGRYLKAWAEATPDPGLKHALSLVAARETTHGENARMCVKRSPFAILRSARSGLSACWRGRTGSIAGARDARCRLSRRRCRISSPAPASPKKTSSPIRTVRPRSSSSRSSRCTTGRPSDAR